MRILAVKRRRKRHSLLYTLYMRSWLWRARRRIWLRQAGYRCQWPGCDATANLTIHHRTYARLGHERRGDVEVLCWVHHRQTDEWRHAERAFGGVR